MEHDHEYLHAHGVAHEHPEGESGAPARGHYHSEEEKKRQLNRISRVIGHLQHVKRMIEADEDCADVLTQLSATRSAITGLGKEIMNEHLLHCITHAIEDGDTAAVEEFKKAVEKFF